MTIINIILSKKDTPTSRIGGVDNLTGSLVNLAPEIDSSAENFKVENQDPGEDVLDNASEINAGPSTVIKLSLKSSFFYSL